MVTDSLGVGPWEKVVLDLFTWDGAEYLVMVDYHSSFPEIAKLGSTTSAAVVNHIKSVFARYGVPREVVSDNGAQFSVEGFARFANEYGFDHRTSSPLHPEAKQKKLLEL